MAFKQAYEFIVGFWGPDFGDRAVAKEELKISAISEHAARRKVLQGALDSGRFVRFILPAQTVGA